MNDLTSADEKKEHSCPPGGRRRADRNEIYDMIIVGSGPAGMSAAIYACRAGLRAVVLERQSISGGQILNTYEVDNYPGLPDNDGYELSTKLRGHAEKAGAVFVQEEVISVEKTDAGSGSSARFDERLTVRAKEKEYRTKTVIWAAGAVFRKLGVPGEEQLTGKGVSYCATCDGAFFKEKVVAVVGGGDAALEDALFLARSCERVIMILRGNRFRGAKILQEKVLETKNIHVIYETEVQKICGSSAVSDLILYDKKKQTTSVLTVQGVFIAVGIKPNTEMLQNFVQLDENGYVVADETGITNISGFFAAGDVRNKQLRQIVTAVADGANCVMSAERYLSRT